MSTEELVVKRMKERGVPVDSGRASHDMEGEKDGVRFLPEEDFRF